MEDKLKGMEEKLAFLKNRKEGKNKLTHRTAGLDQQRG